jgi:hypothetical protein
MSGLLELGLALLFALYLEIKPQGLRLGTLIKGLQYESKARHPWPGRLRSGRLMEFSVLYGMMLTVARVVQMTGENQAGA